MAKDNNGDLQDSLTRSKLILSLTSVSSSKLVIEDANKLKLPCQRVHAMSHGLPSTRFKLTLADAGFESNRLKPLGHHASPDKR